MPSCSYSNFSVFEIIASESFVDSGTSKTGDPRDTTGLYKQLADQVEQQLVCGGENCLWHLADSCLNITGKCGLFIKDFGSRRQSGRRLDGLKWGCHRLMLLGGFNVSRSAVHRLWNQYQTEASVSRRHVPGRPRATTPAGFTPLSDRRKRRISGLQLVADHSVASGRRISALTVRRHFHNSSLYARQPVVSVPLNRRQRWGGTLTGVRYRDEILDPYVRPYAVAIGNDFILMDDNARPHRAIIVEEYLEGLGLGRIEWPVQSPD
ncbi:transposable element Tcb2 transposase [Trichonephila clavipes]|nr:transposable element Tcb2 transposase [Trichonephila clavipes]